MKISKANDSTLESDAYSAFMNITGAEIVDSDPFVGAVVDFSKINENGTTTVKIKNSEIINSGLMLDEYKDLIQYNNAAMETIDHVVQENREFHEFMAQDAYMRNAWSEFWVMCKLRGLKKIPENPAVEFGNFTGK